MVSWDVIRIKSIQGIKPIHSNSHELGVSCGRLVKVSKYYLWLGEQLPFFSCCKPEFENAIGGVK